VAAVTAPLAWGLQSSPQHVTYDELVALWQRAEDLGYDSAWLFDHFTPISGGDIGPCLEGWTTLAALAAQTSRLRLGLLVTSVIYRNPGLLAKIGATVDHVSRGRLEMGMGAGWFERETLAYGLDFPGVGERLARLDEGIQVLRALWTQETTSFAGRHYALVDARCDPKPLQRPMPPIWIGGQGERVTLRIVAERADGWDADMLPLDVYDRKLAALAGHCERAGRDPGDVRRMIHFAGAIDPDETVARRKAELLGARWGTTVEDLRHTVLLGSPAQAAEQLLPYVERGVESFVLSLEAPYDLAMVECFVGEVAPLLRA
jgi:F420-dependent oxidoreductase-like protein